MNPRPQKYSFQRYLSAKRTVDDRALNRHVWESLHSELARKSSSHDPLTILEIGGGIGTMVERLLEEGRLPSAKYHMLDEQIENIAFAGERLLSKIGMSPSSGALIQQFEIEPSARFWWQHQSDTAVELSLYATELYDFLARSGSLKQVDLVLAHAFMDLVDIPATLPQFTRTLQPGALFYFTINFDGATILEPAIDPHFDQQVEHIFHRTMDERITNGVRSGDSHTGRHLFHQMKTANIHTLDAGSSDWVVIPHHGIYPADEGYFLHFIVNIMYGALRHHPDLDQLQFEQWIAKRQAQVEAGELIYIAHQMDYLGEYQPMSAGASIATSRPSA